MAQWRNGSAIDSRSLGWAFESLLGQISFANFAYRNGWHNRFCISTVYDALDFAHPNDIFLANPMLGLQFLKTFFNCDSCIPSNNNLFLKLSVRSRLHIFEYSNITDLTVKGNQLAHLYQPLPFLMWETVQMHWEFRNSRAVLWDTVLRIIAHFNDFQNRIYDHMSQLHLMDVNIIRQMSKNTPERR